MDLNQYFHFTSNLSFSLSSQLRPYCCSVTCCGVKQIVNFFKLPFHTILATGNCPELLQGWGWKEVLIQMLNWCLFPLWNVWPLIMVPNFPLQDLIPSFSADVVSPPWAVLQITSMQLLLWNPFILGKETLRVSGQPQAFSFSGYMASHSPGTAHLQWFYLCFAPAL